MGQGRAGELVRPRVGVQSRDPQSSAERSLVSVSSAIVLSSHETYILAEERAADQVKINQNVPDYSPLEHIVLDWQMEGPYLGLLCKPHSHRVHLCCLRFFLWISFLLFDIHSSSFLKGHKKPEEATLSAASANMKWNFQEACRRYRFRGEKRPWSSDLRKGLFVSGATSPAPQPLSSCPFLSDQDLCKDGSGWAMAKILFWP